MNDLGWGLQMTLAGMGTVFALLIVLMLLLMAIGRLDRPKGAPELGAPAEGDAGSAPAISPVMTPGDSPGADGMTDDAVGTADSTGGPQVRILADGLTDDEIAAITAAVLAHRNVRRHEAAPEMRTFTPGSHLYASRWVAVGRTLQTQPWRRR